LIDKTEIEQQFKNCFISVLIYMYLFLILVLFQLSYGNASEKN